MKWRLGASYLGITTFVLVVIGYPFVRATIDSERDRLRNGIERDAVVIASTVEDVLTVVTPETATIAHRVVERYNARTGARVVITDDAGTAIADNDPPASGERSFRTRPEIIAALAGRVGSEERYSATLRHTALFVAVPVQSGGSVYGVVRLSVTTEQMDARIRQRLQGVVLAGSIALVGAALLALVLARSLTKPLAALGVAATKFGNGALGERADTASGPPEVRKLARDLNAMSSRIEELVIAQDAFVVDASHQLRSPLTAARLRLEAMEFSSTERREEHRAAALDELQRLSRSIDGLLALAKAERGSSTAEDLDLRTVIDERIDAWSALTAERSVSIVRSSTGPVFARVSPDRLTQVLDNLIANAVDASALAIDAEGAPRIEFVARSDGDDVELIVRDNGPGMSDEQRAHAFDRFWRASSRRTELSGSGLGLSIARKLVLADQGTITLAASPSGGLDVVLRYPSGRSLT